MSIVSEYEKLIADQTRLLGSDHPDTLTTLRRLAEFRFDCRDYAGAVDDYGQLHTARARVHGADHPDTLNALYNLASLPCDDRRPRHRDRRLSAGV
ncbi:tetratricopeptide repeat protein [Nocardia sp. CA-129566]|uniref:tetratricopeptide repeat protein n=1 Tax=Nocardia sp. CA-129566 TaxID=3239976 RepID=UPI003D9737BD